MTGCVGLSSCCWLLGCRGVEPELRFLGQGEVEDGRLRQEDVEDGRLGTGEVEDGQEEVEDGHLVILQVRGLSKSVSNTSNTDHLCAVAIITTNS